MSQLIAFTGKAGAGKSSAAEGFVKQRFIEASFARRAKEFIRDLLHLKDDNVFGDKSQKEAVIPHLSKERPVSGRLLLQTFCTEWARDVIHQDIWIDDVSRQWDNMKNVPGFRGMVISDLRFENEATWIKSQGGMVIKIVSVDDVSTDDMGEHRSEGGIPEKYIDAVVVNYGVSKDQLFEDVEAAIYALSVSTLDKDYRGGIDTSNVPVTELIVSWANRVFPDRTISNALQKLMMHEIPEYLMKQDDELELADLGILLYDIAHLAGYDLDTAIRKKMAINEQREWEIDNLTGLMSHIKTATGESLDAISHIHDRRATDTSKSYTLALAGEVTKNES